MRFSLRNASIWAFLALFSSLSLLGPGLHSLVGDHWHGPVHAHAACAHDHDSKHCHATNCQAHTTGHDGDSVAEASACDHDCPICEFFALAQWSFDFQPAQFEFAAREFVSLTGPNLLPASIGCYQSRAPPATAAIG